VFRLTYLTKKGLSSSLPANLSYLSLNIGPLAFTSPARLATPRRQIVEEIFWPVGLFVPNQGIQETLIECKINISPSSLTADRATKRGFSTAWFSNDPEHTIALLRVAYGVDTYFEF
jgi:hypothetical protein